ncbi:MAG: 2-C-methyl-D-erythritol 2,4-cyclodiphosphate synthase, partial [Candidatus Marinimicrobia bacterium]|nr:2-C-methyl-D-erythritol 2,4-cyclodiphosphate synthase [Candidatus Neomarinimicrobiota bacterium]
MFKTGIGIDVHAFTDGDGLVLGGVKVPYQRSVSSPSDGDVV